MKKLKKNSKIENSQRIHCEKPDGALNFGGKSFNLDFLDCVRLWF